MGEARRQQRPRPCRAVGGHLGVAHQPARRQQPPQQVAQEQEPRLRAGGKLPRSQYSLQKDVVGVKMKIQKLRVIGFRIQYLGVYNISLSLNPRGASAAATLGA